MNEDFEFTTQFLENNGFTYYADLVKEILAENVKLKEINEKLSGRLSWKLSDEPTYQVK